MLELTKEKIQEILKKCKNLDSEERQKTIKEITSEMFLPSDRKAVLGMDIFQYSQFPNLEQALIPYLFNKLRIETIIIVLELEPFIFQFYTAEELEKSFIDTGDGGFQIFNNPLEAIVFAVYFQLSIHRYNFAGTDQDEDLFNIIGKIKLRFSVTFDNVYSLRLGSKQNFYGVGIINNARILSRDKLDRCLIDENVLDWFYKELNGFENLSAITDEDFFTIDFFKGYNKEMIGSKHDLRSVLFRLDQDFLNRSIQSSDVMHIGNIKAKKTELSVHCIYLKILLYSDNEKKKFNKIATSLGSLNPQGLNDNN